MPPPSIPPAVPNEKMKLSLHFRWCAALVLTVASVAPAMANEDWQFGAIVASGRTTRGIEISDRQPSAGVTVNWYPGNGFFAGASEPPRVFRRPPSLALRRASGERQIPIVSFLRFGRRHVPEQAEQATVVIPVHPFERREFKACSVRHDRRCTTSALYSPLIVSASALSYESPTLPADGCTPESTKRSVYRILQY